MKHIHKYERRLWGDKKTVIYRCTLPDCTHYLMPEFVDGRKSICSYCGNEFVISRRQVVKKIRLPHCGCRSPKPKVSLVDVNEVLRKLGVGGTK